MKSHRLASSLRLGGLLLFLLAVLPAGVQPLSSAGRSEVSDNLLGQAITALAVAPGQPATVYAGTAGKGAFKSTDGGETWSPVGDGLPPATVVRVLVVDPSSPSTVYLGTDGAGIFKSADSGKRWSPINSGLYHRSIFTLAFDPTTASTLYAGMGGAGVFKSLDGGQSWQPSSLGFLADAFVRTLAVDPTRPRTVYAGVDASGVFKSNDGGSNWSRRNDGLTSRDIFALVLDRSRSSTLYAGTLPGGIFQSTDGAASWAPAGNGLTNTAVSALALDRRTPSALYAGTLGGVFKTANGARAWTPLNGRPAGQTTFSLALDPNPPYLLYVGTDGQGVARSDGSASQPESAELRQVPPKLPAAESTVTLQLNPTGYGVVNVAFAQEIADRSGVSPGPAIPGGDSVYLKLADPALSILDDPSFQQWTRQNSVGWYLSFASSSAAGRFLAAFWQKYGTYQRELVVELRDFDYDATLRLQAMNPLVRIHTPGALFWPREIMKTIVAADRTQRAIAALSLNTKDRLQGDIFDDIHLTYDTLYDAAKDVEGGTGISLNYPPGSELSLSSIEISRPDEQQNISYLAGVLSAAVVISVQTQNHLEKAPPRYVVAPDLSGLSPPGRAIERYFAEFLSQKPLLVWPWAVLKSGGPWKDRPGKPIAGVIGRTGRDYMLFLTNTSAQALTAGFRPAVALHGYAVYSSQRGLGMLSEDGQIGFAPYETLVVAKALAAP